MSRENEQLNVSEIDGDITITIGKNLLSFAVQNGNLWPEDFYIDDIDEFTKSFIRRLQREEEDGTTPIHRMFDMVADDVLEQGDQGVEEGDVQIGIDIARKRLDG